MRLLLFLLFSFQSLALADNRPLIAVASNLRPAMQQISLAFEQKTGIKPRISYASSGLLSQQITQGAPFVLFISANPHFVDRLPRSMILSRRVLAFGQLALMTPMTSTIPADPSLHGLSRALQNHQIKYFVIANPNHAPVGLAARQTLQQRKLWQSLKAYLLNTENAAQAVHYIASGVADAGLVPYSLALSPALQKSTRHVLLTQELQPRLPQTMALLKTADTNAKRLYQFMQQAVCRDILQQHGYRLPQN